MIFCILHENCLLKEKQTPTIGIALHAALEQVKAAAAFVFNWHLT